MNNNVDAFHTRRACKTIARIRPKKGRASENILAKTKSCNSVLSFICGLIKVLK